MTKVEELIQKVRDGKVAILNDGTVEQLRKGLRLCFPLSAQILLGNNVYYSFFNEIEWQARGTTSLPTVSVKEFYEDEFVWGEEVEVSDSKKYWVNRFYVGKNPICSQYNFIVVDKENGNSERYQYIRKIPLPTQVTEKELIELYRVRNNIVGEIKIVK